MVLSLPAFKLGSHFAAVVLDSSEVWLSLICLGAAAEVTSKWVASTQASHQFWC
jgi:hypothetical protein